MATNVKKFLDQQGVGTLWSRIVAKVDASVKAEADRADAAEKANADAAKAADDKAVALAAKVGEVPADKTVVQMISEAQTAATYDDTKVKQDIQANADAITLLNNGSEVAGSVDYKIAQAVAAIMQNPDDTMNSINELVTWINNHAEDALELSNQVSANKDGIAALVALVGSENVATQITDAIAAALKVDGVDKYALATDLTAAIGRIAAIEGDYLKTADKTALNEAIALKANQTYVDEELAKKAAVADLNAVSAVANAAAVKSEVDAALALKADKTALEAEVTARQNAVKANTDAIKAIKDHDTVDSFADVMAEIAKKQDTIPANTYDVHGAAAQALTDAKKYSDDNYALIKSLSIAEIDQAIAEASV